MWVNMHVIWASEILDGELLMVLPNSWNILNEKGKRMFFFSVTCLIWWNITHKFGPPVLIMHTRRGSPVISLRINNHISRINNHECEKTPTDLNYHSNGARIPICLAVIPELEPERMCPETTKIYKCSWWSRCRFIRHRTHTHTLTPDNESLMYQRL